MGRNSTVIPKAPLARILAEAGAKRVSDESLETFVAVMTEIAEKIAEKAIRLSKHTGRKTIMESDVKLAAKD